MASFSFQHHPILVDSAPMANQHIINQEIVFSQFHYPTILSDELITHHGTPFHESTTSHANSLTKKQSSDESTVVDKLESSGDEQVTQKLALPAEKKRKGRNGISSNSSESKATRGKKQKGGKNNNSTMKDKDVENKEENNKVNKLGQEEPPSGFIHVRARRGQATDSHSLAERVRREKISERMKMLQRLVPGCEKVTGKALMLDEIINYVQSLQNQVEFLSMKLASLNPMFYDFGMDIDSFLMRPEGLQSSPAENNTNNYTALVDNSASILMQQVQRPNAFSLENGSLLWDLEDERQSFVNASGFSNLCSFH